MLLIGIGGEKRSGKNTVANILRDLLEARGYRVYVRAFADPLKGSCARVMTFLDPNLDYDWARKQFDSDDDEVKAFFRPILQWVGTEFFRVLGSGITSEADIKAWMQGRIEENGEHWIDEFRAFYEPVALESASSICPVAVIVPDVRMPNEAEYIRSQDGVVMCVRRPKEGGAVDTHKSESRFDSIPWWPVVNNDGTLADLQLTMEYVLNRDIYPQGRVRAA